MSSDSALYMQIGQGEVAEVGRTGLTQGWARPFGHPFEQSGLQATTHLA